MVTAIETALAESPVGVVTVTFDGQTTTWDHAKALEVLKYWRGRAARALRYAQGNGGMQFSGPDLSRAGR
jgi:hypothetical protein